MAICWSWSFKKSLKFEIVSMNDKKERMVSACFIHIPLPIFGQLSEMGIMSKPCKHLWNKMQSYISINLESQLGTRNE